MDIIFRKSTQFGILALIMGIGLIVGGAFLLNTYFVFSMVVFFPATLFIVISLNLFFVTIKRLRLKDK